MIESLIVACAFAVTTPQGRICIKQDGNIEMPASIELTEASRRIWDEMARVYRVIKNERCI